MRLSHVLVALLTAGGLVLTVAADNEITVTFRWATLSPIGGEDTLGSPIVASTHNAGADFTIHVPAEFIDGQGLLNIVRVIQVCAADPATQSIGHITISGSRDQFSTLRVLVALSTSVGGSSGVSDFDLGELLQPVPEGCLHWSGLHTVETNPQTGNLGMTGAVTVAASVWGSITGDSADSIHVGQVYRLQASQVGTGRGQLTIPVTAIMHNDGLPMHWAPNWQDGRPTIGTITVSDRITSAITASGDSLNSYGIVEINGGSAADAVGISGPIFAQGGIGTIQTKGNITTIWTTSTPGIYAATGITGISVGSEGQSGTRTLATFVKVGEAGTDGTLKTVRVYGDLNEPIECFNLRNEDASTAFLDADGIIVDGSILAPITIHGRMEGLSIRAADIDADITIGHSMQGHIHATEGDINSLTIGYGTTLPNHGLWGTQNGATTPTRPRRSLIAADTIEHLDISQVYAFGLDTPPWILADAINVLNIGPMYWGEIKEDPDGPHSEHYPYVVLGQADIAETFTYSFCDGGVVPCEPEHAIIWCEDFDTFDIAGDHGGEVRFSHLAAGRVFRIGGDLYNYYRQGQVDPNPPYTGNDHNAVSVDEEVATAGQVIINAEGAQNPNPPLHGYSACRLTLAEGTLPLFYSNIPGPASLPEYQTPSVDVGGGAVGLAPFYLYDEDCDPVSGATGENALLQSEFDNVSTDSVPTRPIIVRFYGPVRTDLVSDSPVDLYLRKVLNNTISFTRMPRDSYTVEVNRPGSTGANREIRLYGAGQYRFSSGQYHIRPRESGPPQLYCDFVKFNPAVRDFDYIFDLRLDCDYDGTEDQPWECGVICAAGDFNQDGGADGADVEAFILAWENADPSADVNQDGGIDGRDVETFFIAWEAGGC
ncbi:MAG: hypothetical protein JNK25_09305 [Phycisphaerae bacterium]|nr:hypothetical protein [Phycisphaerae bacterium]